jgi:Dockerin type I domain
MKSESSSKRSLRFESLETRALLAADLIVTHNFAMPEDCDNSGSVSPLDALVVINELNQPESENAIPPSKMIDVDADGVLSPLDALVVINYINRSTTDGSANPSGVPLEARVARLESAIAKGQLPEALTIDEAQELLQTMKSGGRPELGERFVEGRLHTRHEVEQIETEHIATELAPVVVDAEHVSRAAEFLERFATKLKAAGVDAQVIETISGEIKAGIDAKKPLTLDQIKTRLTELGVDVTKLFPASPETPHTPPVIEQRIQALVERLTSAGVTTEVITTITTELKASIDAGKPLSLYQIRARLVELGVDVSKLFPVAQPPKEQPGRWTPSVELVTNVLTRLNVKAETIEIVRVAMTKAKEAGSPLTPAQIVTLLKDNGVRISDAIARLLRPVR